MLSILRLSQLLFERNNMQSVRTAAMRLFYTISDFFNKPERNIQLHRKFIIYENKPLLNIFI